MEDQDPADDENQPWTDNLVSIKEEVEEGKEEMSENQAHADPKPTRPFACVWIDFTNGIPKGFLGYVGAVDQKVLRKTNVGPKDGEGQRETGEIILVSLFVKAFEASLGREVEAANDGHCKGGSDSGSKKPNAVHG